MIEIILNWLGVEATEEIISYCAQGGIVIFTMFIVFIMNTLYDILRGNK